MNGVEKSREKITIDVHRFHLGDAQPLRGEIFDKSRRPFICEESTCLSLDHCGVIQFARGREIKELLVRHTPPEEIGKARGEFILLRRRGVIDHRVIEELRRN